MCGFHDPGLEKRRTQFFSCLQDPACADRTDEMTFWVSGNSKKDSATQSDLLWKTTNTSAKAKPAKNPTFSEWFRAAIKDGKTKGGLL